MLKLDAMARNNNNNCCKTFWSVDLLQLQELQTFFANSSEMTFLADHCYCKIGVLWNQLYYKIIIKLIPKNLNFYKPFCSYFLFYSLYFLATEEGPRTKMFCSNYCCYSLTRHQAPTTTITIIIGSCAH